MTVSYKVKQPLFDSVGECIIEVGYPANLDHKSAQPPENKGDSLL